MSSATCPAQSDPHSNWPPFCPNLGAAILFAILFGLITLAHVVQAIRYRKVYSWVIIMSAVWQTAAYIFRVLSIQHVESRTYYVLWFVLILLAPLWANAYIYMVVGRMAYNYTCKASIFGIKAWRFGLCFVLLDIVAFAVQATGAALASGDNLTQAQIFQDLHVYMGGIGLQFFFIVVFSIMTIKFQWQMQRDLPVGASRSGPLQLIYAVYAALALISVRIIFRLIEYAQGYSSGIPVHEGYQYVFDSTVMLFALVLFNIIHPGRIMAGTQSDLPSRKTRRAAGTNHVWGRAREYGIQGMQTYEPTTVLPGQSSEEVITTSKEQV